MSHNCIGSREHHMNLRSVMNSVKRHAFVIGLTMFLTISVSVLFVHTQSQIDSKPSVIENEKFMGSLTDLYQKIIDDTKRDFLEAQQSGDTNWSQNWLQRLDPAITELMSLYCHGEVLHTIQMANVFQDSKYFVDMPIRSNSSAKLIFHDFEHRQLSLKKFVAAHNGSKDLEKDKAEYVGLLREFLNRHFDQPGSDMIPATPNDYQEHTLPPLISTIKNSEYQNWAFELHQLWKHLGRIPQSSVRGSYLHTKPEDMQQEGIKSSQYIVVVPGGRFRESYYWDSLWIITGLLISDLKETARNVVNNLLNYVAEYGFVPNGGRIYYLTRSQPPMLSEMVKLIAQYTRNTTLTEFDLEYLSYAVPILEKEYSFWMKEGPGGHAVTFLRRKIDGNGQYSVATHTLNRYISQANHPRPESYREDFVIASSMYPTANNSVNQARQDRLKKNWYNDLIAAAESGWDFSSRWLRDGVDLRTVYTSLVLPVDLNAFMFRMEENLRDFHIALGNRHRARFFDAAATRRAHAIEDVLWNEKEKCWKDYDLERHSHRMIRAASDYSPLWAKAFNMSDTQRVKDVIVSLNVSGLIQSAGVQATTTFTGQQWDAPNAWPPEQDLIIEGLLNLNTPESNAMARDLARRWVHSGFIAWKHTGLMYEKYNATQAGNVGYGGEYFPQFGFGWANGVILKYLTIHQNLLLD